ncbi:MAG: hypothetical protein ACR2OM_04195, partial [Aestuariivirgaceae bacterium]
SQLRLDQSKPIVICDVDEVVFHFIAGFEQYLFRNDLWLDPASFALNGNVKYRETDEPVENDELRSHFAAFFDQEAHRLDAIDGAAGALLRLANSANVLMLTNLSDQYRKARIVNLTKCGMPYPVIANQGPKGPAVEAIIDGHDQVAVFVDDIPNYLRSVNDTCPDVHLVHFMQDERFGRHIPPLDYVSARSDNWVDAHAHIDSILASQ